LANAGWAEHQLGYSRREVLQRSLQFSERPHGECLC
jgi:hypothetical protein